MRANLIAAKAMNSVGLRHDLEGAGIHGMSVERGLGWIEIAVLAVLQMDSPTEAGRHELVLVLLDAVDGCVDARDSGGLSWI